MRAREGWGDLTGKTVKVAIMFALLLSGTAWAGDCGQFTPFGQPTLATARPITMLCRLGYASAADNERLVPDWVAWTLTPQHAMGCLPRVNPFRADPDLSAGHRATPGDYAKSGFDLGHLAPFDDFAWSQQAINESFYTGNMSPQRPGLNRQAWEEAEADTRAWAVSYGNMDIIDGPIWEPNPDTIGSDHVAVPIAFFKVVYSETKHQTVAIIMDNMTIPKGNLPMYVVSVSDVERAAGISIPLPADVDKAHVVLPWPADTSGYAKAKKAACAGK